MTSDLANHLWQSTLFALAAAVLVAALRGNRAPIRHAIWVIASVKWLVPFAWLTAVGTAATGVLRTDGAGETALRTQPDFSIAVLQFTQPFTAADSVVPVSSTASNGWLTIAVVTVWACGALAMVAIRARAWLRIRAAVRQSSPLDVGISRASFDVRSAPGLLEPGVVGIWRPILLLPAGIESRLTPAHLEAIVAHELCHVRRRDNLTSAVHMVVESAFWFHPVVWWIGARLIEERERACDEAVLRGGAQPRDYAEGIVRVCKLYVESPVACVSGVTGSNLKRRIEDIMSNRVGRSLSVTRKVMLTTAAACALAAPVVVGALAPSVRAQSAPPAPAAVSPQTPVVGDLSTVVKAMSAIGPIDLGEMDKARSERYRVERERHIAVLNAGALIGKTYSGIAVVDAVRLGPNAAVVMALPDGAPAAGDKSAIRVVLGFTGSADDEKLQQLRKGTAARLRGTLTRFRTEGKVNWAEFADLIIEGSRK